MDGLFYPVSKVAWVVLAPSHMLLWMAIATAVLTLTRRARAARWLAGATALAFVALGILPVGTWLARPLESAYPPPAQPPAHVDGILTLGGGLETRLMLERHAPGAGGGLVRLVSTYELARRYPDARVVFSGGSGPFADAIAAGTTFDALGLDPARLVLEDRSRNTFENLAFSRRLVRPQPGQTWVLATSAIQMPRAMAVARRLGWTLIPWPTDYVTRPRGGLGDFLQELNVSAHLNLVDEAAHEWLGLAVYQLDGMGRGGSAR